ncbi:MAG TPA: MG2 domain-containing protein [Gemmatimonadales bacterium]|jgi:hypothetical protein
MRIAGLVAAALVAGLAASSPPNVLHVLRSSPSDPAEPGAVVSVVFDRPVAGQLDGTVDPHTIFRIEPAVAGRLEWRDPITLRFVPGAPLTPYITYSVTIAPTFEAMDGSKLAEAYRFSFRIGGPRVLTGSPMRPDFNAPYVRPTTAIEILVSAPVDLPSVSEMVRIEAPRCGVGDPVIHLNAISQRPIGKNDPDWYRYAGNESYWRTGTRTAADTRRVIRLVPEHPIPLNCQAVLSLPARIDRTDTGRPQRWNFSTYGPLVLRAVHCTNEPMCPAGWARVEFSTPVKGTDVLRSVHITPATPFTVDDSNETSAYWSLDAPLRTRSAYTVTVDPALKDVFEQPITGNRSMSLATTGYAAGMDYPTGRMLIERGSFRTMAVRHVNTDTLYVTTAAVPESLEAQVLSTPDWNISRVWASVAAGATTRAVAVESRADVPLVSAVKMPAYNAATAGAPSLTAVRISRTPDGPGIKNRSGREDMALVQVTDLGVAVRLGMEEAGVWVTTLHDGKACAGADIVLYDGQGRVRAHGTTDADGLAHFTGLSPDTTPGDEGRRGIFGAMGGYVAATLGSDRAVVGVGSDTWQLSPWRFNVQEAEAVERVPAAAAVFTERGIYRPGEMVHAKAIVRTGSLGSLRVPLRSDSVRWVFYDREDARARDSIVSGSAFGTADQSWSIPADQALGTYRVGIQLKRGGDWLELGSAYYRVAEYRPPEFLVTVTADSAPHIAGDSMIGNVEARYLFGAPMGHAAVQWTLRRSPMWVSQLEIPGTGGWELGEGGWWWEDEDEDAPRAETVSRGSDTLDASGHLRLASLIAPPVKGRAARLTIEVTATDVNRQTVTSAASVVVHPAAFYIAARTAGDEYFWRSGVSQVIQAFAVRPDGRRLAGIPLQGRIVRREWHRVQRSRNGVDEQVGDWVSDTVAQCNLTTADTPVSCRFTPAAGGSYIVVFTARDPAGRTVSTSFYRWATGRGWVPWDDENQFKMDVIPDQQHYSVGDTATVLFASPFTDAEAWITVEREGIIDQRRIRITSGATSLKFPLTEAYVPNVYISIVVARGRSAPAGGIADPGRPALRVGYAQLKVTPRIKKLDVTAQPLSNEYRPGDTARVRVRVTSGGAGQRAEVTLWAVDEGVLALTGYRTPDPVELIYRPRGVGMRLASNLIAVAAQVSDSEGVSIKGEAAPGGGGGLEGGEVLRSRFSSTAFFLGSVITDDNGEAVASARLPDNLTTFRVMAVAVTAGDRYGSAQSPMLVTRPLLARPALPRFLREDDRIIAGVVVNQRAGGTPRVTVRSSSRGVVLSDAASRLATLAAGRGTEVRFSFRDTTADTAQFRFDVTDGRDSDAVLTRLPVQPSTVPRAYVAAGTVGLTSAVELTLPDDIDAGRSRLIFDIGPSPLALIAGMQRDLGVYPFDCSEQLTDELLPLVALLKAGNAPDGRPYAPAFARHDVEAAVRELSLRQRSDGGIGLWSASDWTSPWLSAYAGDALLAARDVGVSVNDSLLARLGAYLFKNVHQSIRKDGPIIKWFGDDRLLLGEQVAAVEFLSRSGHTDMAGENELLRHVAQLYWEDRVRLASVIARRGAVDAARRLLAPVWAGVTIQGRRAVLPDSASRNFYFWSSQRPIARLLSATLAVDSASSLIGPLVETLISGGREGRWWWNTQDYGAAVMALADFTQRQQRAASRGVTLAGNGRILFRSDSATALREWSHNLVGLLTSGADSSRKLSLTVTAGAGGTATPLYYYVTVHEVPKQRPVRPDEQGIAVERWYEDFTTGRPIVSIAEGSLVRVRLRIRVTHEQQFIALTDPLPAGLEAVDLSLRTSGIPGPAANAEEADSERRDDSDEGGDQEGDSGYRYGWYYGWWDGGWWSPFDHREMHDDRVSWVATYLWPGTWTATYVARATTPGIFFRPPAHAEEMYNPGAQGRSDGGLFTVTRKP